MEKTLDGILKDSTEAERKALKAVEVIVHQDGFLNRMSEGDKNTYGAREVAKRMSLVAEAAQRVTESNSIRIQSLVNDYLSRMAVVVDGNESWGHNFKLNVLGVQNEVRSAISEAPLSESRRVGHQVAAE